MKTADMILAETYIAAAVVWVVIAGVLALLACRWIIYRLGRQKGDYTPSLLVKCRYWLYAPAFRFTPSGWIARGCNSRNPTSWRDRWGRWITGKFGTASCDYYGFTPELLKARNEQISDDRA
jgi:hypothetical protein